MSKPSFLEKVARGLVDLKPTTPPIPDDAIALLILWVILDHSGSMAEDFKGRTRLQAAKRGALTLLRNLWRAGRQLLVGVMAFDDHATIVLNPTPSAGNEDLITGAVQSIQIAGGTDLRAPLAAVQRTLLENTRVQVVMLTDGQGGDPIRVAQLLKSRGVTIQTVGVGNDPSEVNEATLRKVASVVNEQVLYRFLTDPDDLDAYFGDEIAGRLLKLD